MGQSHIYLTYHVDCFCPPLEHQLHERRDVGFVYCIPST